MRSVLVCLVLSAVAVMLPAHADEAGAGAIETNLSVGESQPDELFARLKRERNEKAAGNIAAEIRRQWNQSGSATIDLMMSWSATAITARKFNVALDFLDQVVTLAPDYAEGWSRRAAVHALMRNYRKSMADIVRTLQYEPRHFDALAGMAQIFGEIGDKELALEAWRRVLDVYPMKRSAQSQIMTLAEELGGQGI